ncbi:MAG TPA: hypothetical protein VFJ94_02870 [Intrasporangium sp.]|uniref:hypothetical protein n=1 Tax=Intrasporangium sp. TaxID=1925024 RepID=UPI002D78F106|nr:hypothetical protein [Intrasporangium sp.]HET7397441.1 hypothetical protein [Intrasporangium sp.]
MAQEAAWLVDLLAARAGRGAAPPGSQHGEADGETDGEADGGAARETQPPSSGSQGDAAGGRPGCGCGTARAADPGAGGERVDACTLCPVCQLIDFVGRVSPETIERVADVVALAATALHDLASAQRVRRDASEPEERR